MRNDVSTVSLSVDESHKLCGRQNVVKSFFGLVLKY